MNCLKCVKVQKRSSVWIETISFEGLIHLHLKQSMVHTQSLNACFQPVPILKTYFAYLFVDQLVFFGLKS